MLCECRRLTWQFRCQVDVEIVALRALESGSFEFYGFDWDQGLRCKGHGSWGLAASTTQEEFEIQCISLAVQLSLSERQKQAHIFTSRISEQITSRGHAFCSSVRLLGHTLMTGACDSRNFFASRL